MVCRCNLKICHGLAPRTVSLTGNRDSGDGNKHDWDYTKHDTAAACNIYKSIVENMFEQAINKYWFKAVITKTAGQRSLTFMNTLKYSIGQSHLV